MWLINLPIKIKIFSLIMLLIKLKLRTSISKKRLYIYNRFNSLGSKPHHLILNIRCNQHPLRMNKFLCLFLIKCLSSINLIKHRLLQIKDLLITTMLVQTLHQKNRMLYSIWIWVI